MYSHSLFRSKLLRPHQYNFLLVGHPMKKKDGAGERLNDKIIFICMQNLRRYIKKMRTIIFFHLFLIYILKLVKIRKKSGNRTENSVEFLEAEN